jgi:hypothetical protein
MNGPTVLIEYGDYHCPCCKRAHSLVKRLLEEKGNDLENFPSFLYRLSSQCRNSATFSLGTMSLSFIGIEGLTSIFLAK